MKISESIRLDAITGKFDPNILEVGDFFFDEHGETPRVGEIIKITSKGIKVKFPDGSKEVLSFMDLYKNSNLLFGKKAMGESEEDLELGEAVADSAEGLEMEKPDPHLINRWVFLPNLDSRGVIEGLDFKTSPVTAQVLILPYGPKHPEAAKRVIVPITDAQLINSSNVYETMEFDSKMELEAIEGLTGVFSLSAVADQLKLTTLLDQFKAVWVYLPNSAEVGVVTSSPSEGVGIVDVEIRDLPLETSRSRGRKAMALEDVVPIRSHKTVALLHKGSSYRGVLDMFKRIYPPSFKYPYL